MSHTGLGGGVLPRTESEWQNSEKRIDKNGTTFYGVGSDPHRSDGPAIIQSNGHEEYFIQGLPLNQGQIDIFKSILSDITLSPLYVSHPIFKYPAKFILNGLKP